MNVPELWNKTQVEKILKCQCINCGGHLETHDNIHYKCLYCETKYTVKQDAYRHRDYIVEVVHPNMITLGTRIPVSPERVAMYSIDDPATTRPSLLFTRGPPCPTRKLLLSFLQTQLCLHLFSEALSYFLDSVNSPFSPSYNPPCFAQQLQVFHFYFRNS